MNASPWFRRVMTGLGALWVFLASTILVRGTEESLREFAVPEAVLTSAHFDDAITWVYVHMVVLGVLMIGLGRWVTDPRAQRNLARLFVVAQLIYLYLDIRSSDSALGNGLYQGPASLIPVVMGIVFLIAFLVAAVASGRAGQEQADPQ